MSSRLLLPFIGILLGILQVQATTPTGFFQTLTLHQGNDLKDEYCVAAAIAQQMPYPERAMTLTLSNLHRYRKAPLMGTDVFFGRFNPGEYEEYNAPVTEPYFVLARDGIAYGRPNAWSDMNADGSPSDGNDANCANWTSLEGSGSVQNTIGAVADEYYGQDTNATELCNSSRAIMCVIEYKSSMSLPNINVYFTDPVADGASNATEQCQTRQWMTDAPLIPVIPENAERLKKIFDSTREFTIKYRAWHVGLDKLVISRTGRTEFPGSSFYRAYNYDNPDDSDLNYCIKAWYAFDDFFNPIEDQAQTCENWTSNNASFSGLTRQLGCSDGDSFSHDARLPLSCDTLASVMCVEDITANYDTFEDEDYYGGDSPVITFATRDAFDGSEVSSDLCVEEAEYRGMTRPASSVAFIPSESDFITANVMNRSRFIMGAATRSGTSKDPAVLQTYEYESGVVNDTDMFSNDRPFLDISGIAVTAGFWLGYLHQTFTESNFYPTGPLVASTCDNWTTSDSSVMGTIMYDNLTTGFIEKMERNVPCNEKRRVYCLYDYSLDIITASPTVSPSVAPSTSPTASPTGVPTASPTPATNAPTATPTLPTNAPTAMPTVATGAPTPIPSSNIEDSPAPTSKPTKNSGSHLSSGGNKLIGFFACIVIPMLYGDGGWY